MRIAVFDYKTVPNNPTGGCHRRILSGLCREHEFTVFAAEFDNPCPKRIAYVRVPAIKRPLALLFISFHVLAPIWYWWNLTAPRSAFRPCADGGEQSAVRAT